MQRLNPYRNEDSLPRHASRTVQNQVPPCNVEDICDHLPDGRCNSPTGIIVSNRVKRLCRSCFIMKQQ
jgi:hypothetical protein